MLCRMEISCISGLMYDPSAPKSPKGDLLLIQLIAIRSFVSLLAPLIQQNIVDRRITSDLVSAKLRFAGSVADAIPPDLKI